MSDQEPIPPNIARFARRLRRGGWWDLIIGLLILIYPLAVLLDPAAAMPVNGVPRKEFVVKLGAALFAALFPLSGAALVLTPQATLERLLVKLDRFMRSLVFGQRE